jgi:glycosyltransferase involved in cell wall biosynthesis
MRILQVSAHFPPEFVSGGTLQPQRIAHGLRAAGHEVAVLAGSLDETRPPVTTWDEADPTGMPVRWIAVHPFIWWDDERNYDNPRVAEAAGALLDEWQPEVVHCHSLQTLGVGVVEEAAARRIGVVLTMHDFWWVCARQFLVDTGNRPCSLVVAASDCPCEAGRPFLEQRNRRLASVLQLIDRILVPSATAAEVMVANGVDESRLAVDENGMPEPPTAHRATSERDDDRIVVRYTGGSNPLKGADVLVAALTRVGRLDNLRVVAHDLDEAVERSGRSASRLPVELRSRYVPEELDELFTDTDVLLVPSVMRETYSIVTREALARGVPVIATDSLGPEEVVTHDRNGLVLPAGDADALANALSSLHRDPGVAARWRVGTGGVQLRSVEEQVAGLEQIYAEVAAAGARRPVGAAGPPGARPRHRAVLFVVGITGAPLRYRARLPAEALELAGVRTTVRHYRDPDVADVATGATHVVVYRVPATPTILDLIAGWRGRGTPVAFDVDDLIFDPEVRDEIPALGLLPPDEAALWLEGVDRYRTTMEACDAYIGSTPRLVEHAGAVVGIPGFLFENGVGCVLGAASDRALRRRRRPGPTRVGYLSGTSTHDDDWRAVAPVVLRVLERHPEVELWLGGHLTVDEPVAEALGERLRRIPFTDWDQLPEVVRDLDVNLAPLAPSGGRFNDAKSAIKWLEAALCETPTIASPTEPFQRAIDHGTTGMLASDEAEWERALDHLLTDAEVRRRLGRQAKRSALLTLSPPRQGHRYLRILDELDAAHRLHRRPDPRWAPVVRDEPPEPRVVPLDPYPPGRHDANGRRRRSGSGPLARLRSSLREDGPAVTSRRVAAAAARRLRG